MYVGRPNGLPAAIPMAEIMLPFRAVAGELSIFSPKTKKIDAAMAKKPELSQAQIAEVKKYRAEGEQLHKAGKHQESVDTLAKAMKILGIQ